MWDQQVWAWLAFPAMVLFAVGLVLLGMWHRNRLKRVFSARLYRQVLPRSVVIRRTMRDVAIVMGIGAGLFALAGPQLGKEIISVREAGLDIILAVDLSRSMDCRDIDPSRLERARREILDLIEILEGDRVGLVIFAGGAYPRMPLSRDRDALRTLVGEMNTAIFEAQGSNLAEAIHVSVELLGERSEAGQAILIISDGEAHDIDQALKTAREAAAADIQVYALGVGNKAAPVPSGPGTYLTENGQTVLSKPNPAILADLARAGGGAYVQSVASALDMEQLYRDGIRRNLNAAESESRQREIPRSDYQWPLGVALIILILGGWIGEGHRRWGAAVAVGLAILLATANPAFASNLADGDALYRAEKYNQAVDVFTELSMSNPSDPEVFGRLAAARYRAGDFHGAARAWENQSELLGNRVVDADFNAGNAHYRSGSLEEALNSYDRVLARQPTHEKASRNQGVVRQELEARRMVKQKQQQQEQQSGEGESEEKPSGDKQEGEGSQEQGGEPSTEEGDQAKQSGDRSKEGTSDEQGKQGKKERKSGDQTAEQDKSSSASDQEKEDPERDAGTADLDNLEDGGEGETQGDGGKTAADSLTGPITEASAEKLLEGVEEGRPRVRIPGRSKGNPW